LTRFFEYIFVDIEKKDKPQGSRRRLHKPDVGGSIPLPAIIYNIN